MIRHATPVPGATAVMLFASDLLDVEHVSSLLAALAIAHRVSTRPSPECVSFCKLVVSVAILVAKSDPLHAVSNLRSAGVHLPTVVLGEHLSATEHQQLRSEQQVVWRPRSLSPSALNSALEEVTAKDRRVDEPAGRGMWLNRTLLRAGQGPRSVRLARPEFALLEALVSAQDRPLSVRELADYAWGEDLPWHRATQLVTVRIHHLRHKLARLPLLDVIHTVRNVGYVYHAPSPLEP